MRITQRRFTSSSLPLVVTGVRDVNSKRHLSYVISIEYLKLENWMKEDEFEVKMSPKELDTIQV